MSSVRPVAAGLASDCCCSEGFTAPLVNQSLLMTQFQSITEHHREKTAETECGCWSCQQML